jgi:peptidyl-prolyl cis-trans isomerase SurA
MQTDFMTPRPLLLLSTLLALLMPAATALAQSNPFAPVIMVNDSAITGYEIDQRARFLALIGTPGDVVALAEDALIDDRIYLQAARQDSVSIAAEQIEAGMAEFAGRAELSTEEFVSVLASADISMQSFRDFVSAGLAWREVVSARFMGRVMISDAEIDRALAPWSDRGRSARVLISEIVLPAPPGQEARAEALALELSALRGEAAFASAARQYSAAGSRANGGQLDWMPVANLPATIRGTILGLTPGEISAPVALSNAFAVFLLRNIDENASVPAIPQILDFAQLLIPNAGSASAQAELARLELRADSCNDLYGLALGLPSERLLRDTLPLAQIPTDIAMELARLDPGESSTALRRGSDQVFLMLCARTRDSFNDQAPLSRDEMRVRLQNARLATLADAYLADLKAAALIRRP